MKLLKLNKNINKNIIIHKFYFIKKNNKNKKRLN